MSRFRPEPGWIDIGAASAVVRRVGDVPASDGAHELVVPLMVADDAAAWRPQLAEALRDTCWASSRRMRPQWKVRIGNVLTRHFVVTPPAHVRTAAELRRIAQLRFEALFGQSCESWSLQADWSASRPFLACAVPQALVRGIVDLAAELRAATPYIVDEFSWAWNASRLDRQAVGARCWVMHEGRESAILAATHAGRIRSIAAVDADAIRSGTGLLSLLQQWALRWSCELPTNVVLLEQHGQPMEWIDVPDLRVTHVPLEERSSGHFGWRKWLRRTGQRTAQPGMAATPEAGI